MATPEQKPLTVDGLMAAAFDRPREHRSAAYKAGVRAALVLSFDCITRPAPYNIGTAEADAFFAGEAEGRQIIARTRMSTATVLQRIEQCIDVAPHKHPLDRAMCAETFIAALSGVLQRDDMALSNRVFALLTIPKKEAVQ